MTGRRVHYEPISDVVIDDAGSMFRHVRDDVSGTRGLWMTSARGYIKRPLSPACFRTESTMERSEATTNAATNIVEEWMEAVEVYKKTGIEVPLRTAQCMLQRMANPAIPKAPTMQERPTSTQTDSSPSLPDLHPLLEGRLRGLEENCHVLFYNLQMAKHNERRAEGRRHQLAIKLQAAQEENELLMLKLRTIHEAARV